MAAPPTKVVAVPAALHQILTQRKFQFIELLPKTHVILRRDLPDEGSVLLAREYGFLPFALAQGRNDRGRTQQLDKPGFDPFFAVSRMLPHIRITDFNFFLDCADIPQQLPVWQQAGHCDISEWRKKSTFWKKWVTYVQFAQKRIMNMLIFLSYYPCLFGKRML